MAQIEPDLQGQRFGALWEQRSRRVLACALRHVDPDTAQEVLSETFLVAWRRLPDVPGTLLPWLLVVARNTIANQRRSTYRRAVVHRELAHLERVAEGAPVTRVVANRQGAPRARQQMVVDPVTGKLLRERTEDIRKRGTSVYQATYLAQAGVADDHSTLPND